MPGSTRQPSNPAPIREARERVLSGDEILNTLVRKDIEASWRRCQLTGVTPTSEDVPFDPDFDRQSRLLRAAAPVLDRLAQQLADIRVSILLADARARIIDRRAGVPGLLSVMDRANIAPGFAYAEEVTGTNGVGTALEERRPCSVFGGEHFRENLQEFHCVGAPVRNPLSGTVEGVLDATCATNDSSPLILPLIIATVRDIETRLYAEASSRERLLLEHFLKATRRSGNAVVALNQELMLTNTAAAGLVDRSDHAVLWDQACRMLANRKARAGELRLGDAVVVKARYSRIEEGTRVVGAIVEMVAVPSAGIPGKTAAPARGRASTHATPRPIRDMAGLLPGRSSTWTRCLQAIDAAVGASLPVLITGESGTGKLEIARSVHLGRDASKPTMVLECSSAGEDPDQWFALLRDSERPRTVILRHLDALPVEVADRVAGELALAQGAAADLMATFRTDRGVPGAHRLSDYFASRINVPPLRYRTEDIPDIAPILLSQCGSDARLQPAALQVLMRLDWPGNLRELQAILAESLVNSHCCDIAIRHLPAGYRDAPVPYRFTSLERAARDVILQILLETDGNKLAAAEKLGVARSTLYRKMRALGIDDKRLSD